MRRYAVITAATAAMVIGGGVAFGSTQQGDPAPTPSPVPASAIQDSVKTQCEHVGDDVRGEHPDAYVAECNYGENSITTP
jgi:hypothetical protein